MKPRYRLIDRREAYFHGVNGMLYRFLLDEKQFLAMSHEEASALLFEVQNWCIDQFTDDRARWGVQGLSFNFRDEVDATAFRIRWC